MLSYRVNQQSVVVEEMACVATTWSSHDEAAE
jgi:hypothetical protein